MSTEIKRPLDIVERSMEALFGLIMVLTFTGSLSVMTAGRQDVREMLMGALGCNLAWGVIDACFHLMGILTARGHGILLTHRLRGTKDDKEVSEIYAETMPDVVVEPMTPAERESLRRRVAALPDHLRSGSICRRAFGPYAYPPLTMNSRPSRDVFGRASQCVEMTLWQTSDEA